MLIIVIGVDQVMKKITVAVSNDDNKPLTNVPIFARLNGKILCGHKTTFI